MIPNETSPRYVAAHRLSAEVKVWLVRHQFSWTSAQEHRHCQVSAAAHPSQCVIRENRPSAASQCSQSEVPIRSRSNDETFQPHRVPTTRQRLQGIKPVFWCSLVMLTAGDRRPPQGKKNSHDIRNSGKKVTDDPPPDSRQLCSIFLSRVPYRFSPPPRRTRDRSYLGVISRPSKRWTKRLPQRTRW